MYHIVELDDMLGGLAPVGFIGLVTGIGTMGSKKFILVADGSYFGDTAITRTVPCDPEAADALYETYKKQLVTVTVDTYGFLKLRRIQPIADEPKQYAVRGGGQ